MKKTILLFIGLVIFFFLPLSTAKASYGDVCNEANFGVKVNKTDSSVTISADKKTTSQLKATLKCDNVEIGHPKSVNCLSESNCQITVSTQGLKGSCNLFVIRELRSNGQAVGIKKCSVPIQTIYITNLGKLGEKEGNLFIKASFNKPPANPKGYYVMSDCYNDWFGDDVRLVFDHQEGSSIVFSTTDYNPNTQKSKCTVTVYSPSGGEITTQEEAIQEADQQQEEELKKAHPNDPCSLLTGDDAKQCWHCMYEEGDYSKPSGKVWTVFGCVRADASSFIFRFFFNFFSYIAGGFAALLLIYAAFLYMTSAGDSEKVKKAQSLITAVISGILFIIFSIMIMKFIGVSLLGIPTLQ